MSHNSRTTTAQTHVVVTDTDFTVRFVSAGFCDTLDCESADLLGTPLADWLHDKRASGTLSELRASLDGHDDFSRAVELRDSKGFAKTFDFRMVPVLTTSNDTIYMAVGGLRLGADLTEPTFQGRFEESYGGSSLTYDRGVKLFRAFEQFIGQDEGFRDPQLTIGRVSRRLGTNTQYLSQVVNFFSGQRFSIYVNQRRLESLAVRLSAGEPLDGRTAWAEVGFGSYSSFYRSLKRHYGVSPAAFFFPGPS